jgi:hypothetical protein
MAFGRTLSESVARFEADSEILKNRLRTLEEFYTDTYNRLKAVTETHPDCIPDASGLVSFQEAIKTIPRGKDELKTLDLSLEKMSEFYRRLVEQYENVRSSHPEWL